MDQQWLKAIRAQLLKFVENYRKIEYKFKSLFKAWYFVGASLKGNQLATFHEVLAQNTLVISQVLQIVKNKIQYKVFSRAIWKLH